MPERVGRVVGTLHTSEHTMRLRTLAFACLLSALPALAACSGGAGVEVESTSGATGTVVCTSVDAKPGAPKVYFAPFDPVEDQVLCALDQAQTDVWIAHYNIRTPRVLEKLAQLRARGVVVEVAVDKDNAAQPYNTGDDYLEQRGVRVVRTASKSGGLMHLKAAVIDRKLAMTGSFNWNQTASLANDESMLVFRDQAFVDLYWKEIDKLLHPERTKTVTGGTLSSTLEVHFSPQEKLDGFLVREIRNAKTSIDVAAYTFTSAPVADELVKAAQRGVVVRVVTEKKQASLSNAEDRVEAAGALVIRGANAIGPYSAMHHKYAIFDQRRVAVGAANWSAAGLRTNEEDLLVLEDARVAQSFAKNFADLLYVYTGKDATTQGLARGESGALFHAVHGATQWGDTLLVVGSDPALGAWDPGKGVPMGTSDDMFPNWTARAALPAGAHVEYKFVVRHADGSIAWEPGANRTVDVPSTGRSLVRSGAYGDTSKNWTPSSKDAAR